MLLEQLLVDDPDTALIHAELASAYALQGNPEQAQNHQNLALNTNPQIGEYFADRACTHFRWNNYLQAVADANSAMLFITEDATARLVAYTVIGLASLEQMDYEQAINSFTQALSLDPASALLYDYRGTGYLSLELYELALDDFNRAIEIAPAYVSSYNGRATCYENLGYADLAAADRHYFFDNAVMYTAEPHLNFGRLMLKLNEYEPARASFAVAIAMEPENAEIYLALGELHHAQGKSDFELAAYREYMRLAGESADPTIIDRVHELEQETQN